MNELVIICILIICLLSLWLAYKKGKNLGLISIFITSNILTFILNFKYIEIKTLTINANAIVYVTMFISLYLLIESKDKKSINKIINLNFLLNLICATLIFLESNYVQSLNDTIGINMKNVFVDNSRILLSYPFTMLISQKILLLLYNKVKNIYDNLFISMVTTYLAAGLIESILYMFISYYGILSNQAIIKLLLSTYMLRLIITVIYAIFLTIIPTNKKVLKWQT